MIIMHAVLPDRELLIKFFVWKEIIFFVVGYIVFVSKLNTFRLIEFIRNVLILLFLLWLL